MLSRSCWARNQPGSSTREYVKGSPIGAVQPEEGEKMQEIEFRQIEGIKLGHAQDLEAATGCTVIISEEGATAGVDVRGGAPGTRETDLLNPMNMVQKIHAVLLAGGSAFGLDAASGVMQFLEERGIGFDVQVAKVPLVCGAVLFDLALGDSRVRPDGAMGYRACRAAYDGDSGQGNTGAGAGAAVGKIFGMSRAMKSGLGTFAVQAGDLKIGAVVAVNALGDIIDPETGERLAGTLNEDLTRLADTEESLINSCSKDKDFFRGNTTIGVVVSNAALTKDQASKMASMAHDGYARSIRPAHTMFDGDTIFAMATGRIEADFTLAGLLAARVVERAVVAAVKNASTLCGLKSYTDLRSNCKG
jgi:L-aminopeptidase/D-esterase-like protein